MFLTISIFHAVGASIITGIVCLIVGYKLARSKDATKIDSTVQDIKNKV
jgi:hypothetical protein